MAIRKRAGADQSTFSLVLLALCAFVLVTGVPAYAALI
jgi:hypothetical protein